MKIVEMFQGIQGEGLRTGVPSFFIRTWGCNLRCEWCDTKYSYEGEDYKDYSLKEIVQTYNGSGSMDVVITGGEPFCQLRELEDLVYELAGMRRQLYIETNATIASDIVSQEANLVLSPKLAFREVEDDLDVIVKYCAAATHGPPVQIKIVVDSESTYEKAKELTRRINGHDVGYNVEWIFTPNGDCFEWDVNSTNPVEEYAARLRWLVDLVLKDCNIGLWHENKIRVLPQLHKIIWGNERGV